MLILRILENDYLLRALGQGAFGEVYQGILKSKSDSAEVNVAVKTLPELSTNQGLPAYSFIFTSFLKIYLTPLYFIGGLLNPLD